MVSNSSQGRPWELSKRVNQIQHITLYFLETISVAAKFLYIMTSYKYKVFKNIAKNTRSLLSHVISWFFLLCSRSKFKTKILVVFFPLLSNEIRAPLFNVDILGFVVGEKVLYTRIVLDSDSDSVVECCQQIFWITCTRKVFHTDKRKLDCCHQKIQVA